MSIAAPFKKLRLVRNDLPLFLKDLRSGAAPVLLIAPAAWEVLPELPHILGFFRNQGVRAFFPVLPFADIATWVYHCFLRADPEQYLVSSACAGMNSYMRRKHPYAAPKRSVYSPLLCAVRYLKTYRGMGSGFAFLSPCSWKHLEFSIYGEELIRYNITIDALSDWLETVHLDICTYPPLNPALEAESSGTDKTAIDFSRGITAASFGTISGALACLFPHLDCTLTRGIDQAEQWFSVPVALRNRPGFFEPYACAGGCANGSGLRRTLKNKKYPYMQHFPQQHEVPAKAAILERFSLFDRELQPEDFYYDV